MIRKFALALASIVVTLALVEGTLRVLNLYPPLPYPPTAWWTEYFSAHPDFGYALRPGTSIAFDYPPRRPRTTTLNANSDGLRQKREIDGADDRRRALVLGDSFTFGIGVEEHERFTDLVEEALPWLRVDNASMPGWGTDMMLLAAEALVERARPDYVLVTLIHDDFRRVRLRYAGLGFATPRFRLSGDSLEIAPYPKPALHERTHLHAAYSRAMYGGNRLQSGPSSDEWLINERILDRLRGLGETHGFRMAFVWVAGRRPNRVVENRQTWLIDYAERHSVPFHDLTPALYADSIGAFLFENSHYSPKGHRLVANSLTAFMDSIANP